MALVLRGRLVTFDDAGVVDEGELFIDDEGRIEAVQERGRPAPPGYAGAPRVATGGSIYPGLVDLHNHVAYNWRGLWTPSKTEPYGSRYQWPDDPTYRSEIRDPTNVLGAAAGEALVRFVEVKALVGGTTAIQGSARLDGDFRDWLVRNVEYETFGAAKSVYQSVLRLPPPRLAEQRAHMEAGNAFLYHLAEGTDDRLLVEFDELRSAGCLRPELLGIHSTALDAGQFGEWAQQGGGTVVWSPLSNILLYGETTDVAAARAAGLRICLGADWGPSGSKNVLGELKVADLLNRRGDLGPGFSDEDLCRMVTANSADALGWSDRIGRLRPGLLADVAVVADRRADPYRNLIDATERHVRLVVVGGRALFGSASLLRRCGVEDAEPVRVGGVARAVALAHAEDTGLRSWADVLAELEEARRDPGRMLRRGVRRGRPLRVLPDMPGDELDLDEAVAAVRRAPMPALDSISHDRAFFDALERAPIAGGKLEGLRQYHRRS